MTIILSLLITSSTHYDLTELVHVLYVFDNTVLLHVLDEVLLLADIRWLGDCRILNLQASRETRGTLVAVST